MEEKEILAELVKKYGRAVIMMHFVDNKMSAQEIKDAFIEKERKTALVNEAWESVRDK